MPCLYQFSFFVSFYFLFPIANGFLPSSFTSQYNQFILEGTPTGVGTHGSYNIHYVTDNVKYSLGRPEKLCRGLQTDSMLVKMLYSVCELCWICVALKICTHVTGVKYQIRGHNT